MKYKKYDEFYNHISEPFRKHPHAFVVLKIFYYMIPVFTAAYYIWLLIYTYLKNDTSDLLKTVLIPLAAFTAVTVFRKAVNAKRPYEKDIKNPLISRGKSGESFPSRHTASLGIIAMAGLYSDVTAGIILWIMTIIQGMIRIICGVHYPKDIAAGMAVALIIGALFFIV